MIYYAIKEWILKIEYSLFYFSLSTKAIQEGISVNLFNFMSKLVHNRYVSYCPLNFFL